MPQASASSTFVRAPPPTRTGDHQHARSLEHALDVGHVAAHLHRARPTAAAPRSAAAGPDPTTDRLQVRGAARRSGQTSRKNHCCASTFGP